MTQKLLNSDHPQVSKNSPQIQMFIRIILAYIYYFCFITNNNLHYLYRMQIQTNVGWGRLPVMLKHNVKMFLDPITADVYQAMLVTGNAIATVRFQRQVIGVFPCYTAFMNINSEFRCHNFQMRERSSSETQVSR